MTRLIKNLYFTVVNIYQCRTELRSPSLKLSDSCKHVHTVVHIDLLYTVKNGAENTTQRYSVSEIKEESRDKQYIILLDIMFCHTVKLVKSGWVNIIFLLHWNTLPIVNNRLLTCWQLWLGFFSEYAWHMILNCADKQCLEQILVVLSAALSLQDAPNPEAWMPVKSNKHAMWLSHAFCPS